MTKLFAHRHAKPAAIAAAVIAGAVLIGIAVMAPLTTQQPVAAQAAQGGPPPASVFVEPVRTQTFANRVEAIGTLEANERADLTLSASDRVTAVYFEDGERVKAGKTLISLAQREQSALVEGAEADLARANQELARLEPLAREGAVSQAELDGARRDANAASAQLRAVQSRQRDRVLVAPFDGVLGFRQVSVGSFVRPGDVVATLIDDSVMRLDFAVPSIFLNSLKPGLAIEARSSDLPGKSFEGTVSSINNSIDPVTRSVRVRAMIPNKDGVLKTGMFVAVTLLAEPREALSVPEVALQPLGPETFVWIVSKGAAGNVANRVKVQVGQRQNGRVEILAGLSNDQQVITEGVLRLREGGAVTVRDQSILKPAASGGTGGGAPVGANRE
ncbi:MAG: efflux RND transporter periplasmic adaptor subunit [Acidobacteria bacterium]|jgi:membrane fusion protein (multidrug efflux system)|nr:efflux RND transporter periplasmic adaptor subunit [Acidobacteriota bacterium]